VPPRHFMSIWVDGLLGQCRAAKTLYFLKQFGANVFQGGQRIKLEDGHGGDWSEWPPETRVGEMPKLPPRTD